MRAEIRHLRRPGREHVRPGEPQRDAAKGRVALPDRGGVVDREVRAGRVEPAERAVDVGPPGGRAPLDDDEPVGGEDERRELAAELLRRAERGAVETRPLAARSALRTTETVTGTAPLRPASSIAGGRRAVPDQLRVRARARREALRADVERLEQVRLAGAVRAGDEDEPRLERELQPGIRPEVAERDLGDDQPASLIGMIRYQNESSSADVIRPGRSGLISFSRTVSPRTESTPSARNSALKPISSGSPVYAAGSDSARLADVLALRRHRQLALGEAQPQRRVAEGHHAGATDDVAQLRAREVDLDLERLGQRAGRRPGTGRRSGASSARCPRCRRRRCSRCTPSSTVSVPAAMRCELRERARRDDRLEVGACLLELASP